MAKKTLPPSFSIPNLESLQYPRNRAIYVPMAFHFPTFLPGESHTAQIQCTEDFIPDQIVLNSKPSHPQLKYYMKRAGGSKRKGQRASWLYTAESLCIKENPKKYPPKLTVTSIQIGVNEQLFREVHISLFIKQQRLCLDTARKGFVITATVKSSEVSRDVNIQFVLTGSKPWTMKRD